MEAGVCPDPGELIFARKGTTAARYRIVDSVERFTTPGRALV